jgi:hypothetical protein
MSDYTKYTFMHPGCFDWLNQLRLIAELAEKRDLVEATYDADLRRRLDALIGEVRGSLTETKPARTGGK